MAYQVYLPKVFPFRIQVSKLQARVFTEALLNENRTDRLKGSSYAITVDADDEGFVNLWLSQTSYVYLIKWFDLRVNDSLP